MADVPAGFAPFEPQGPFLEHIGPVLVRDDDGVPIFGLRVEERHTNHRGTVQGGLLSTFVDFALGRAIEADADDGKDRATVSLTVDFLRPATPGDWIESRARVERITSASSGPGATPAPRPRESPSRNESIAAALSPHPY